MSDKHSARPAVTGTDPGWQETDSEIVCLNRVSLSGIAQRVHKVILGLRVRGTEPRPAPQA